LDTQQAIRNYDYQTALNLTAGNKFLKRKKNTLLYHLELGRLFHLQGQYQESNKHLNYADDLMDYQNSLADFAASVLVNSNAKKYRAEDFEKILIHYYKALNYSYLNQTEDALVEARRMNLKEMELSEKGKKKYNKDAFGHLLMGQIYEKSYEYNNAFIAYRNAYEAYTEDFHKLGETAPNQLKIDILKTAYLSGLYSELNRYEKEFNIKYTPNATPYGEVILYWENGQAPFKVEKNYIFSLVGGVGGFYFVDDEQTMEIPFLGNPNNNSLSNLTAIRVAMPKYRHTTPYYQPNYSTIEVNGVDIHKQLAPVENINQVAEQSLQDRFMKDLGTHLTKLAINKLAQQALKSDSTTEALGMVLEGIGFITEQADTRNWQSLPSLINYSRVPLTQPDTNLIQITLMNQFNQKETIEIPVVSKGNHLQFKNVFTPDRILSNNSSLLPLNDSLTLNTISP
jgi:hypothetical protein